ncbi:uncharacterized protein LOC129309072 isoform X2 [Prosopis cineraria]|uniref:uncharacterized protein LOC129299492 isoform X2 n=1 Tax=Prosopis cineraria TaxID=364024 RepID=UPI00240EB722|nr:uncharacterized protein LOC129299492 isoform X2 [Prosopis cineraria]XP_054793937.1 uncharacterized protein LOC129299492 isoform X2 [Prosopis cineraria]XP_054806396.1 uncharacterized protein LOC129309072 isoform X2 [Prosopis cineraria]XP_054806397.1 uncharacterized protein LOC129309072 isoform X2 [Prosopis cineraria]
MDTDEELSIVLELSKDDIFYDKKEVELYFADDASTLGEFYSPRNELEALNSIISLIDTLLSSCKHPHTNLLRELRTTILALISDFGGKDSLEAKVEKDHRCEQEEQLLEWGKSNGIKTQLWIAYVKGAGRGGIAEKDLKVGDIALEIPVSIIINEELVHETDMYCALKEVDGISPETILLLWSMKERHNQDSRFRAYFDSLPENFNTGLSFGIDAITTSEGTLLLEEIMEARQHLHAQYDQLFPTLCNAFPDIFPLKLYTWEQFLWACELWYSNSMKIMFSDGTLRTCLIPIAGFLNHSLCPHILHYGKVDPATNSLKFPLSRPCRSGEECCLSYGNFSNSHLITFYGFLPQGDNPYDVIPLDIDASGVGSLEDEPVSSWSNHMVRGTWLSNNHNLYYYGLPSPLLDHFRRCRNPMLHTKTFLQGDLENELEILEDLRFIFDNMMDNLDDTNLDDNRENCSWDEKLALEYKILQRRMVSSISTSCNTGIDVVKNELYKCMAEDIRG